MKALLVSCYELGRQPFNIASPWAMLEAQGFDVHGVDTSIQDIAEAPVEGARLVAISVPMHTALRLGIEIARALRERAPNAHICFFGMYASLNAEHLLATVADSVLGGEFEQELVALAMALREQGDLLTPAQPVLRKLPFVVPKRDALPPLSSYATFFGPTEGERRQVGYVEASRGCLHRCRHCPVTAIYDGKFFVVPRDIVLADAAQQVAAGAGHITFGDPDFFNGPKHVMAIVRELAARHPGVTFDITVKVEHILRHRDRFAELAELGCAFVISAVESLSDRVLEKLDKGHDKSDVFAALEITRAAGLALRPTFVAFTPWTTLEDYIEAVDWIVGEHLVDHVEPIQLAIRLLVPRGSALLWQGDADAWLGPFDDDALGYTWRHPDPRMDRLFETVSELVEAGADDDPATVVLAIRNAAYALAERTPPALGELRRRFVPHLSESWFCCAEPTARQMEKVRGKRQTPRSCG